jgi:hypothetical protein
MPTTFCSDSSGRDAKLYYNSGTVASPTWVEIKEARDLSMPMTAESYDDSDRSTAIKLFGAGGIEVSISGKLSYRNGNANCETIRDLFFSRCAAEFALMDGPIATSGSEGFRGGFKVFTNSHEFPLADGMTVDIELKPAYFENGSGTQVLPAWYTVGS